MNELYYEVLTANAMNNIGLAIQYIGNLTMTNKDDKVKLSSEVEWILLELKTACSNMEAYKNMLSAEMADKMESN